MSQQFLLQQLDNHCYHHLCNKLQLCLNLCHKLAACSKQIGQSRLLRRVITCAQETSEDDFHPQPLAQTTNPRQHEPYKHPAHATIQHHWLATERVAQCPDDRRHHYVDNRFARAHKARVHRHHPRVATTQGQVLLVIRHQTAGVHPRAQDIGVPGPRQASFPLRLHCKVTGKELHVQI